MHSILFIYESESPTVSMMREVFIPIASELDLNIMFKNLDSLKTYDLCKSDIVIFVRSTDPLSVQIAKECRKSGRYIIAYYDDDLMDRPHDRPIIPWRRSNVRLMLASSDIVLTSSNRIGKKYEQYTVKKQYVQLHTIIHKNEFRTNPKMDSDTVRILYAANSSHASLIDEFIKPAIRRLYDINKKISFNFFGVQPTFKEGDVPDNVEINYIPTMPFKEYREYMNTHDFDMGIAPIFNDEFSKCKYFNKYLEYAIFQIPGIFTNSEPYTDIVTNGTNGLLVGNNDDEWTDALRFLILNKDIRNELGYNALNNVKANFTQEKILSDLLSRIPELEAYESPNKIIKYGSLQRLKYRIYRTEETLFLAISYFTKYGLNGLRMKVKKHFSEQKAFNGGNQK